MLTQAFHRKLMLLDFLGLPIVIALKSVDNGWKTDTSIVKLLMTWVNMPQSRSKHLYTSLTNIGNKSRRPSNIYSNKHTKKIIA